MSRPRSEDPKEVRTIRLRRSTWQRWEQAAAVRGTSWREHLQTKLEQAAAAMTGADDSKEST